MGLESLSDYDKPTTPHYNRVKEFMVKAKQDCPSVPTIPSAEIRVLRAKLVLEEALELIKALGVSVGASEYVNGGEGCMLTDKNVGLAFNADGKFDMVEVMDGCADVSVVNIGTLVACGIPDVEVLRLVDENNLAKFGAGSYTREDGKHIKPPGHKKPDFAGFLAHITP